MTTCVKDLLSQQEFVQFCEKNFIPLSTYEKAIEIPRFIRVRPCTKEKKDSIIAALSRELKNRYKDEEIIISSVTWIPEQYNFYYISQNFNISQCESYQNGDVYGMDISSAMAVLALEPTSNDDVLDLCCAPGAKLSFIADYIMVNNTNDTKFALTGVDISLNRLHTCKSILKKYKTINTRLILADGTNFEIVNPTHTPLRKEGRKCKKFIQKLSANDENMLSEIPKSGFIFYESMGTFTNKYRQEQQVLNHIKKKRKIEAQNEEQTQITTLKLEQYDKVLVDAECTTDGSIKHLLKIAEWGWETFKERILNDNRLVTVTNLQKQLISNGFKLLKPGGIMVYSTCSLTREQNENIVEWLLSQETTAQLVPAFEGINVPYRSGQLENTYRFDPESSNTSGLFISKIKKSN